MSSYHSYQSRVRGVAKHVIDSSGMALCYRTRWSCAKL